jgi:hypothetical protein
MTNNDQDPGQYLCQYIGPDAQSFRSTCSSPLVDLHASYCAEHYALVYQQGTARRKRHKEIRTVDKVRLVEQLMMEAIAQLEAEGFDVYGERELDLV